MLVGDERGRVRRVRVHRPRLAGARRGDRRPRAAPRRPPRRSRRRRRPPRGWGETPAARAGGEARARPPTCCARGRLELAALEVRECAKPWAEADADVCEAIDFLEYYARQAVELERAPELLQVRGERNTMRYAGRGVAAVIAPWNFPIAIPCGMTAAALAAGNAVVLKPAEQSPGVRLRARQRAARGGRPGRRARRSCRASATPARRSCATRACTRSRSPARAPSGSRSSAPRRRRPTSSGT